MGLKIGKTPRLDSNRKNRLAWLSACLASCALLSACGGNSSSPAPAPSPANPDTPARTLAATTTAQSGSNACAVIQPFYWEIGDKTQRLANASVNKAGNSTTYDADTVMPIASASKWLYGAYVAERRSGALTAEDVQHLHFQSGYINFAAIGCTVGDTVNSCLARGNNSDQTTAAIGKFYYNGGHMQKHASLPAPGMNLGALDSAAFATEMRSLLGNDIGLSYAQPQPAGGVRTTANDYAAFLRKLLNDQLKLSALLGSNKVCTNPATCSAALYTPIANGRDWHYSIGHWVEDDAFGDGAFSSAGAFGFYPWVDASKTWYGVVARADAAGGGNESADCGALIRKAWITGTAQ